MVRPVPVEVNAVSGRILGAAFLVHSALGPGLLERVYEACLLHELDARGLRVERQVPVPVRFHGLLLETGLRLDLLVDDCVVVELKSVEELNPLHRAQLLSYLRLSGVRVGLLLNFNTVHLRDGIERVVL